MLCGPAPWKEGEMKRAIRPAGLALLALVLISAAASAPDVRAALVADCSARRRGSAGRPLPRRFARPAARRWSPGSGVAFDGVNYLVVVDRTTARGVPEGVRRSRQSRRDRARPGWIRDLRVAQARGRQSPSTAPTTLSSGPTRGSIVGARVDLGRNRARSRRVHDIDAARGGGAPDARIRRDELPRCLGHGD